MATTKVRDYAKLARDIRDAIDEKNIISATHCATRLRLTLKKSPSEEVTKRISEMPAVIQVVEKGGQYQIVIGTHAKEVYEELAKIMNLSADSSAGSQQMNFKQNYCNDVRMYSAVCLCVGCGRYGTGMFDYYKIVLAWFWGYGHMCSS